MSFFASIIEAEKQIVAFPGWSPPDETGYMWFNAPLDAGDQTVPGLVLHGGCMRDFPHQHVSLELRLERTQQRKLVSLARIDWRSLNGGHSNQRKHSCPGEWAGRRVPRSHLHSFEANYRATGAMKAGLPCADPLEPEPQSLQALLKTAGSIFRISNMTLVVAPAWGYNLLA